MILLSPVLVPSLSRPRGIMGPVAVLEGDAPKHGFLGVAFKPQTTHPLVVENVLPGSAAEEAGIRRDDELVRIDAAPIPDYAALNLFVKTTVPEQTVHLTIRRSGEELDVPVKLMSMVQMVSLSERQRRRSTR